MKSWVKFIICTFVLCVAIYAIIRGANEKLRKEERDFKMQIHGAMMIEEEDILTADDKEQPEVIEGFTCTRLNVRQEPNTESEVLDVLRYGTPVVGQVDNGWINIGEGYVCSEYIVSSIEYQDYEIYSNGFKSYMPYRVNTDSIFGNRTKQYEIQELAWTDSDGLRVVGGRYCVAIGSYFTIEIGQYFDLILENGTVIPCVLADGKADFDTDEKNIYTQSNGCVSEFIVDVDSLDRDVRLSGDISRVCEEWNSPVVTVRLYNENILK